jgi:hypothetical protein
MQVIYCVYSKEITRELEMSHRPRQNKNSLRIFVDKSWKWVVLRAEKESREDLQVAAEKTKGEQTLNQDCVQCEAAATIGVKSPASVSIASVTHSIRYITRRNSKTK